MKLRITPSVIDEMEGSLEDCQRGHGDPTDKTYIKILAAINATQRYWKKGVVIDADDDDIRELKHRADYQVGSGGVCQENIADIMDRSERGYWLGRLNAYRALLRQING